MKGTQIYKSPKKVIALTGFSEFRTGLLRLVLKVHGREVRAYMRPSDMIRRAQKNGIDMLLTGNPYHVDAFKASCGWLPAIMLSPLESSSTTTADRFFSLKTLDMCELIQAIHILLIRKRGPRRRIA